jgi:hypothetical protein
MTATTTTARVEVLTAEVHVLMVGSRQVTMSMYEQLDWAAGNEPAYFEPFGRVRPRRPHCSDGWGRVSGDCPSDCVDMVGRDPATGSLVRTCARLGAVVAGEWCDLPLIVLAGLR